jgi:hypothetical protein
MQHTAKRARLAVLGALLVLVFPIRSLAHFGLGMTSDNAAMR